MYFVSNRNDELVVDVHHCVGAGGVISFLNSYIISS
jgi:hypothetical protein